MKSRRLLIVFVAALAAFAAARAARAATNFNVTNNGVSAYTIDGVDNKTLTLTRGQTYTFTLSASGHPFWIVTARGAANVTTNAVSQTDGVTGNGMPSGTGTVTYVVPTSAPATLFYQCGIHDVMGGTLSIISPPVTSVGPAMSGALALVLLLVALRRRSLARP